MPPRMDVAIVGAGRVGTALATCLSAAGHSIVHRITRDSSSLLVDAPTCQLIVLSVPDPQLSDVVTALAPHVKRGHIVLHTSGAHGLDILDPIETTGAIVLAMHPIMTFVGGPEDASNLEGCYWGVTTTDELSDTIAELLVAELGGQMIRVSNNKRVAYHAALAYASNYTATVLSDARAQLADALQGSEDAAARVLKPLVEASIRNVLEAGPDAITGPAARDDVAMVQRHMGAIDDAGRRQAYRELARRTAELTGAHDVELWAHTGEQH